tara:strand:- start:281 stop:931 length:651 start_codon:yes stop_codon:yes gene_type:complete
MISSSIVRKITMALSGLFLILFLTQHLAINLTSIFPDEGKTFNMIAHFMGYNPIVQFIIQPILIIGVIFHFLMGFIIEIQNNKSRSKKYKFYNQNNSSWFSRNMIFSGLVILSFLVLHFYDFWVPEIDYKYISINEPDSLRYYDELKHKFHGDNIKLFLYCVSFVFLGFHLYHGFASSLKSIGFDHKYYKVIKKICELYSVAVPAGFILIAIIHFL